MSRTIRIGTRGSALALWQSTYIAGRLTEIAPDVRVKLVEISSRGDQITDQPLWQVEGTGFFTATIERALGRTAKSTSRSTATRICRSTARLASSSRPSRSAAPVEDVLCARDGAHAR